jgi:dTDP-4-amino-4,6-dideoxygalactose transaminase
MNFIPFNLPFRISVEKYTTYLKDMHKFSGDGPWTKRCHAWFQERLKSDVLLTTSCTHALEMMALLIDIQPGDEIIMPSYTFVSTANAFTIRGAKIVFVDVRPDTMNIDENLIEAAITKKTKAIMVVHYAGVACEMNTIKSIANKHRLYLLEDAAQGMMSTYNGIPLGTIGHIGTYSFHETKNYHCGEGGLLIINDKSLLKNAEIIREKGTDRSLFLRGEVDKYTWQMMGSSYLPSELNVAYLYPQLEQAEEINQKRLQIWKTYYENLKPLADKGSIELPFVPENCQHNAHMFYIKLKSQQHRRRFISFMKENSISTVSHYIPLHSAPAGKKYSRFSGEDIFTTTESERLVRLPMFYDLEKTDLENVLKHINIFLEI